MFDLTIRYRKSNCLHPVRSPCPLCAVSLLAVLPRAEDRSNQRKSGCCLTNPYKTMWLLGSVPLTTGLLSSAEMGQSRLAAAMPHYFSKPLVQCALSAKCFQWKLIRIFTCPSHTLCQSSCTLLFCILQIFLL